MKYRTVILFGAMVLISQSLLAQISHRWRVVDSGGGKSTSGVTHLHASVGQTGITRMSVGTSMLEGGFLPGVGFEQVPGSVTGTVSVGSSGLAGVTVKLLDENGGVLVAFTAVQTNPSGQYSFTSVPAPATYQVMIVEPLGYSVDLNPKIITLTAGGSASADFALTQAVIVNDARGMGYWKHQFDVYVTNRGNAQETQAQLNAYIASVHEHYTPHFNILATLNTFQDWQGALSAKGSAGMYIKARRHLASLVLNLASLKLGQYTVVTSDGRSVGDVLTYVSQLLIDANPANDGLANDLAEKVNNHMFIASGIVPSGSILYKGSTPMQWGFSVPLVFALHQNYPNPFNPTTRIEFTIPLQLPVTLKIYDLVGREVRVLVDGVLEAGRHFADLNSSVLASGTYFYRLQAGENIATRKLLLLR